MAENVTIRQLARQLAADPNFLLEKLQAFGLPHVGLNDTVDENDTAKLLSALGKRSGKGTLTKNSTEKLQPSGRHKSAKPGQRPGPPHKRVAGKSKSQSRQQQSAPRRNQTARAAVRSKDKAGTRHRRPGPALVRSASQTKNQKNNRPAIASRSPGSYQAGNNYRNVRSAPSGGTDAKYANRDKKPKNRSRTALDTREERTIQRYGVQISAEDALEIQEVIRDHKVQDPSFSVTQGPDERPGELTVDNPHKFVKPTKPVAKAITISGDLGFNQLAHNLGMKKVQLLQQLKKLGVSPTEDDEDLIIEKDLAVLIAEELGYKVTLEQTAEDSFAQAYKLPENLSYVARPPIVTVMGHVDHGKTSLLDYIRKSRQAATEAGQITQHFGAYSVTLGKKGQITFFDTPGHLAFSEMRARGAKLTDIVVLVVAADDSVKPQTIESIKHARAAKAEIVVAINKTDLEGADTEQVLKDLASQGLQPEQWGGEVQCLEISAKTGQGVEQLLEAILAQAAIMELQAAVKVPGRGKVIESRMDRHAGAFATIILEHGELKVGDNLVCGACYGRVKMLRDDADKPVKSVGPGVPVQILGLNDVPLAGESCLVVENDKESRRLSELNQANNETQQNIADSVDLAVLLSVAETAAKTKINLIIRADVAGSLEAIKTMIAGIEHEGVEFSLVTAGVGAVTESDVNLARATTAIIIGFNVRLDSSAKKEMKRTPVPEVHYYNIIYELLDQLNALIADSVQLQDTDKILGVAMVKEVFSAKQYGQIAGCEVAEGIIYKDKPIRVLRDNKVIYEGLLESLRRFKDNVREVHQGTECGIGVKNYKNVKVGDQIEVYDRLSS